MIESDIKTTTIPGPDQDTYESLGQERRVDRQDIMKALSSNKYDFEKASKMLGLSKRALLFQLLEQSELSADEDSFMGEHGISIKCAPKPEANR